MKFAHKFLLVATAFAALANSSFADQNPTGTWKGKLIVDSSKMQKMGDAKMQAMMEQGLAASRKMVVTIVMKANKTYVATTSGGPKQAPPDTGTWAVKGNVVTMTSSKKNGQGKSNSQPFNLSVDGKTMSQTFPVMMGITTKIVLRR